MTTAESYWEKHLDKKSPRTAYNYRKRFNNFLEFVGLTHEGVYEMQRAAEMAEDPREGDVVVDLAVEFVRHLTQKGYAPGTISGHVTAIKMFMISNKCKGFEISKDEIPYVDSDGSHVITKHQIVIAWDSVSQEFKLRNRAIISFLKDSGLRIGDVSRFTVRNYLELEDIGDGFRICKDAFLTNKRKRNAYLHLGPEATEAVDEYIQNRIETSGQMYEITHGGKFETRTYPIYDEEQALFLGRGGKNMSVDAIGQLMSRIFKDFRKVSAHSLRKFHTTNLEGAGMPDGWVKKLQGKATSVYSQPEKNGELTKKYIECYPALRVFGTEKEEIEKQNSRIEELNRIVAEQQRNLELMGPAFEMAKKFIEKENAMERIREAAKES